MKLPHLKKERSVKIYHEKYQLIDDYAWVDQPNVLEVLKKPELLLPPTPRSKLLQETVRFLGR